MFKSHCINSYQEGFILYLYIPCNQLILNGLLHSFNSACRKPSARFPWASINGFTLFGFRFDRDVFRTVVVVYIADVTV